jgi:TolB protein
MKCVRFGAAVLAGVFTLAAGGGLFAVRSARAESPIIDVRKRADRRIAVGVDHYRDVPADEVGSPPGQVVAFDLELSGWFEPVLPGLVPPRDLADWQRKGAEVLVEIEPYEQHFRGIVRDAGTSSVLFEKIYPASEGTLRRRLHTFCDELVFALTGEQGLARTEILCEWDAGQGKRIVRMDIDGYNLRELTGEDVLELAPRWSEDGRQVVYTSYASGYPDVYVQDLRVGSRRRVAHYEGLNALGHLSPDGKLLVLTLSHTGNPEIYVKDLTTNTLQRLTRHRGTDTSPSFSPDGSRIVFVSDRTGSPQIYVMKLDGTPPERVTFRGNYNTAPDWSPDGTRIAYCALRPDGFQIQVLDLAERVVTTVTDGGGCEDPCWSPDGRSILYSRKAGGRTDLYITNLSERRALRVSRGAGRFTAPDWSPFP